MQLTTYALEYQTRAHLEQRRAEAAHERALPRAPRAPGIRAKVTAALRRLWRSGALYTPYPGCCG